MVGTHDGNMACFFLYATHSIICIYLSVNSVEVRFLIEGSTKAGTLKLPGLYTSYLAYKVDTFDVRHM